MTEALTAADRIEIRNPATGARVGRVEVAGALQVADAVERARTAQRAWERAGFTRRARVLDRFLDLLRRREAAILDTIQAETGKPRRDALSEVLTVVRTLQYYLGHGAAFLRERRGGAAVPGLTSARVVYKPHGVVGFVTPWNYPWILSVGDAIPALLAGNAVIIKPSEMTPLSAEAAVDLLRQAGLDENLAQLVHGAGDVGSELIRHVDYVSFTGSSDTGRKIAIAAGERLIPYSLELGGKNPLIVLEGAPIDSAVQGFIGGAFFNSGQTCIAVERAFVQSSIYDEFVARAVERTRALRLGWSEDWSVDVGSLISPEHADKVMHHIEDARARGAKILVGGRRRDDLGPAFVEPTLLEAVDASMRLDSEETFGPVVALHRVETAEEAIARANDTPYGLNASVWTGRGRGSLEIARRLETGSTSINSALMIYHCLGVPMGGVKQSGIGRRHGAIGIRRFTQAQSIVSGPAVAGGYDNILSGISSPRAARWLSRLFHWRRWIPGMK